MPTHQLPRRVYRGIWEIHWRKTKGAPYGPSPIHHHSHTTGHPVNPECLTIVDRRVNRNLKAAMYICVNGIPQPKPGNVRKNPPFTLI